MGVNVSTALKILVDVSVMQRTGRCWRGPLRLTGRSGR